MATSPPNASLGGSITPTEPKPESLLLKYGRRVSILLFGLVALCLLYYIGPARFGWEVTVDFGLPFLAPFGLFIFSATIESITKYGQRLAQHQGVVIPFKGFVASLRHIALLLHNLYLACFAYALTSAMDLANRGPADLCKSGISYSGKPYNLTIAAIVFAVMASCLAYFHTVYILAYVEHAVRDREKHAASIERLTALGGAGAEAAIKVLTEEDNGDPQPMPMGILHIWYVFVNLACLVAIRL